MILPFRTGDPPEVGRYVVTDGESVDTDSWLEYSGTKVRLPSDIGKPGEDVYRRWSRFENVTAWAPTTAVVAIDVLQLLKDLRENHPSDNYHVAGRLTGIMTRGGFDFRLFSTLLPPNLSSFCLVSFCPRSHL